MSKHEDAIKEEARGLLEPGELDLAISMMGGIKEVREILSEVPIDRVDATRSKWNVLTVAQAGASSSSSASRRRRR